MPSQFKGVGRRTTSADDKAGTAVQLSASVRATMSWTSRDKAAAAATRFSAASARSRRVDLSARHAEWNAPIRRAATCGFFGSSTHRCSHRTKSRCGGV